jgi:hypothetical protein
LLDIFPVKQDKCLPPCYLRKMRRKMQRNSMEG